MKRMGNGCNFISKEKLLGHEIDLKMHRERLGKSRRILDQLQMQG
jgi:hypothetical protein